MRDVTLSELDRLAADLAEGEEAFQMDEDSFRAFYERTARPVWAYLSRMTGEPRARDLLWLAYAQGSTHHEIAEALGLERASIKLLLFRARRRLAALLREART